MKLPIAIVRIEIKIILQPLVKTEFVERSFGKEMWIPSKLRGLFCTAQVRILKMAAAAGESTPVLQVSFQLGNFTLTVVRNGVRLSTVFSNDYKGVTRKLRGGTQPI